jgi:hypothetical protein
MTDEPIRVKKGYPIPNFEPNFKKKKDRAMKAGVSNLGGIDFNSAHLAMIIKRDGHGVPLPLVQQDMAQLSHIQGFEPQIIEIKPAVNLPILSELQRKLEATST